MPVAIVGMHRSGTSMVTRLLNLCGLYLGEGKDLIAAAGDNSAGFWENKKFLAVNNEVLAAFGGGWDYPPVLKKHWESSPVLSKARRRARRAIAEISVHEPWGWKDPRTSLTLPFWKEFLPDLKIVVCLRNPYAVYRSLEKRGYASRAFSYNLWLTYYRQLLNSTTPAQRIITHYDSFFDDPQAELQRLVGFLGLDAAEQTVQQANEMASPAMRHHYGEIENVRQTNPPTELVDLYTELCVQAGPVYYNSLSLAGRAELEEFNTSKNRGFLDRIVRSRSISAKPQREPVQLKAAEARDAFADRNLEGPQLQMERVEGKREKLVKKSNPATRVLLYQPLRRVYNYANKILQIWRREGTWGIVVRLRERAHIVAASQAPTGKLDHLYDTFFQTALGAPTEDYAPLTATRFHRQALTVKLIAFYLPQFHPIPENDSWWGKGFTEWTNVSKAVPQFEGHYQPHHPGELGFYDLRLAEVQKRQIELARQHGLHGFAFYYYWFQGKRLLETPLNLFLASQEEFPFCICWANENWTRRWDGEEKDILIQQAHSPESDLRFIEDITPIIKDRRYIHVNGRPLIIVYRPQLMPEPAETAARWRAYCHKMGLSDPYLVAIQGYGFSDPREVGFDAALEFPPHNHRFHEVNAALNIVNPDYQGKIYSYYEAIRSFGRSSNPPYELLRCIFPGWDNEARKPGRGVSFAFSTPRAYQYWLQRICDQTLEQQPDPQKRLVFINAWNEWAEGAHLEPDRRYGYAYLQATARALGLLSDGRSSQRANLFDRPIQKKHDTAVFVHLYYPDLWEELRSYLSNLKGDFDLFISTPHEVDLETRQIIDFHADTYLYRCDNHGRDIAPFLQMLKIVEPCGYRSALKLHTKKSGHIENGNEWRTDLYGKLAGSPQLVERIKRSLSKDDLNPVGFVVAEGHTISSEPYLASNKPSLDRLARMANIPYFGEQFHFFAGSMFWFRPDTLLPLILLPLEDGDFEPETGQLDGTLAHAIERFIGLLADRMGIPVYETDGEKLKKIVSGERTIYRFAPKKK